MSPEISRIAAQAFVSRQARARELVAARRFDQATAEARLAPWLAIACLAGAELPELADELADDLAELVVVPLDALSRDGRADWCSPAQARAILAEQICPRATWAPLLAKARDEALRFAESFPAHPEQPRLQAEQSKAALTRARELIALAGALEFSRSGQHPVPPVPVLLQEKIA